MKDNIYPIIVLLVGIAMITLGIMDLYDGFSWTQIPVLIGTMKVVEYASWAQKTGSIIYIVFGVFISVISIYLITANIKSKR